ncbi:hypothetical protein LPB87_18560 [Flavobacterium sp. EDS]|uniref:hypothetical protein n=1 Tax=Flavobacterium sp. EDS TaxID=2897328 RepID=UPI001E5C2512|nr:hypothetical protein [Flavobacterium sp. EDS]MCD0476399.1 hypothetical protein [Flavobacterium sp. EDS]
MNSSLFKEKTNLESSEYNNLFGDPFWGQSGSLKAIKFYLQLNEREKALMLKANYIKMIEKARERNFNKAADCLQWWLDGTGSTKNIDFHWLRSKSEVIVAENINVERFETDYDTKFIKFLNKLNIGDSKPYTNHYDKQFTAGIFGELYYMSGTSTITSTCNFNITKNKDYFTLSGTIIHTWWDIYDWHKGADAYIPGFGSIKDSDALLVEKYCGARPFRMESKWQQTFNKTFQYTSTGNLNLKLK